MEQNAAPDGKQDTPLIEAVAKTLSKSFECVYVIDAMTGAYECYHESHAHGDLGFATSGDNFFETVNDEMPFMIHPEDLRHFEDMVTQKSMLEGTSADKSHSFIHRVISVDGSARYHQAEAVRTTVNGNEYLVLGILDVDTAVRREMEHEEARISMLQKGNNYLEAILASSAGYLEANVTKDLILEQSPLAIMGKTICEKPGNFQRSFSAYMRQWGSRLVTEGAENFFRLNDPTYLVESFSRSNRRVSALFTLNVTGFPPLLCRQVAYLYKDKVTQDLMSLNVLYDLTEQQRMERERRELEEELSMCRIRTFTGQMQPHFLYNALGSIQEVVIEDPEYASKLIGDFTTHLRGSIRAMSSDEPIPFEQELENIRAYLNIEKMRLGKKLVVEMDIRETHFSLPPLSIQPLVENAVRHGIYNRGPEGGGVCIRSWSDEESFVVQVEDDGVGFDAEAFEEEQRRSGSTSTGLRNLRFRLEKIMGASVFIESEPGLGTCVTVAIPRGVARRMETPRVEKEAR